jgi:hypothetical protein
MIDCCFLRDRLLRLNHPIAAPDRVFKKLAQPGRINPAGDVGARSSKVGYRDAAQ